MGKFLEKKLEIEDYEDGVNGLWTRPEGPLGPDDDLVDFGLCQGSKSRSYAGHRCWTGRYISVPNRQNTVPLHLLKWRYRALKFLVHFSSFLLTNVPQKQCKVGILKK